MCHMENISEIVEKGIYSYIYFNYKTNRYEEYKRCIMIPEVLEAHIQFIKNDPYMLPEQSEKNIQDTINEVNKKYPYVIKTREDIINSISDITDKMIQTEGLYNYIQKYYKWNTKEFKVNAYREILLNEKYIDLHILSLKSKEVLF